MAFQYVAGRARFQVVTFLTIRPRSPGVGIALCPIGKIVAFHPSNRRCRMAIQYMINEATGVVRLTLTGDVTMQDFLDYFEATRQDPAFRPAYRRLVVIRDVQSFPKSSDVRSVASQMRPRTSDPAVHIAIVADTQLGRGMMAMLMGSAGLADRYRVFDDVTSAMIWLVTGGRVNPREALSA